jgi:hypothetical protein
MEGGFPETAMRSQGPSGIRRISLGLTALLLLARVGAAGAETIRAQVLDAETTLPVAGAIILGVWSKVSNLGGEWRPEFLAVRETETNKEGWFSLEGPGAAGVDEESVTVYRSGYAAWNNLFIFPTSEPRQDMRVPPMILLQRFPAAASHRQHVDFIAEATLGQEDPHRTPRFWKAVRPEYFLP